MNNDPLEDYCSFKLSKLFKEKGLNYSSSKMYNANGALLNKWFEIDFENTDKDTVLIEDILHNTNDKRFIDAIPHSIAIKWLRENFNIHIKYEPTTNNKYEVFVYYLGWLFVDCDESIYEIIDSALEYVLRNNLI